LAGGTGREKDGAVGDPTILNFGVIGGRDKYFEKNSAGGKTGARQGIEERHKKLANCHGQEGFEE